MRYGVEISREIIKFSIVKGQKYWCAQFLYFWYKNIKMLGEGTTNRVRVWLFGNSLREKCPKYGDFSGPYFLAFGLNTERYFVCLRIQSECGKIRTRKNSIFGQISNSDSWDIMRYIPFLLLVITLRFPLGKK